jgi:hypothetical protein
MLIWVRRAVQPRNGLRGSSLRRAQDHFEAALAIARTMGIDAGGPVLGYVGLLHAHRGQFDDARHCLDAGEALLEAVSDRMSLGILLCGRAETEHLAGVSDAASALRAVDAIATEVSTGPDLNPGSHSPVSGIASDKPALRSFD